jgi:hypothetical protein
MVFPHRVAIFLRISRQHPFSGVPRACLNSPARSVGHHAMHVASAGSLAKTILTLNTRGPFDGIAKGTSERKPIMRGGAPRFYQTSSPCQHQQALQSQLRLLKTIPSFRQPQEDCSVRMQRPGFRVPPAAIAPSSRTVTGRACADPSLPRGLEEI